MGLTKQYLRYVHDGTCNVVASSSGSVAAISDNICAAAACENVYIYNIRTGEKLDVVLGAEHCISVLSYSRDRRFLAVGYVNGTVRLYDRKGDDPSSFITFAGHKTGVNCLAFTEDGLTLASGGKDTTVVLWDIVNASGLFRLNGHKNSVTHMQFTISGRYLLSSSKDALLKFWSLDSKSCFYTLVDAHSELYTFSLLKDDTCLLVGSTELELRVYKLKWLESEDKVDDEEILKKIKLVDDEENATDDQENNIVRCFKQGQLMRHSKGRALQLSTSADEKIFTCVGSSGVVDVFRVYNAEESQKRLAKKLKRARKKAAEVTDENEADFTFNENVSKDITIQISRIGDYRKQGKVKWIDFGPVVRKDGENIRVYLIFVLFASNTISAETLVVNLKKNTVDCIDFANLDQLGHRTDIRSLAVAESGHAFLSADTEGAFVWNMRSLKITNVLEDDEMRDVSCCMFVTGNNHAIVATKKGSLFLYDLATNEMLEKVQKAHEGEIKQIVPTPDKKGFVTCGTDKKLQYWIYELVNEITKKRLSVRARRILELPDKALCMAASHDERFIAVGLLDNTARIYFVDTLKFFVSLYGHSHPITAIHTSYDSKLIATGSVDKSVKIWGLDFGDCHKSFHAHDDVVTCVMFSPEEHLLWSAGKDGMLKQWDADKFERIQVLNLHSAQISAIAQSADGKYMISASLDKSIRVWALTEEIIVLQEEQENEREKAYEKRMEQLDDIVPGEEREVEAEIASKKSIESIKSAENIIEAVDIARNEAAAALDDMKLEKHPMIAYLGSESLDRFILDIIQRVPSSHLEKCLLMVPFSYVPDIISALGECIAKHYKAELASRVLLFIVKVYFNHLTSRSEILPALDILRKTVPEGLRELRDICGFNFACLLLFQKEIEERSEVKLFSEVSEVAKKSKKTRKAMINMYK